MSAPRVGMWISVGTLVVALLTAFPAYLVFFDKPDLVYEVQVEKIPLPADLSGKLPDTLLIVTAQNLGRRPSLDVEGSIRVHGVLIEDQVDGPNPAYGQVAESRSRSDILVSCARLAAGDYPIRVSAWYRTSSLGTDVGFSDARGAAREVASIAAAQAKFREFGTGLLGLLVGLLGSFSALLAAYSLRRARRDIAEAARELAEDRDTVVIARNDVGKSAGRPE